MESMKMNRINLGICLILVSWYSIATAKTNTYTCVAKANPDRGINVGFEISVVPADIGGKIIIKIGSGQKVIGIVSEVGSLSRVNDQQTEAFAATLGYIGEEDVSGIPESNLDQVKTIEVFIAKTKDNDETLVYKLFSADKQIGGSIVVSGVGTACLPF
jgi:hypothetical protein